MAFMLVVVEQARLGALSEKMMITRRLVHSAIAGLVGAAMLALPLSSASAFTLSSPSPGATAGASQIDKVWWRGGWGWRGGRWGWWGPGAVIGGLAAGAVVGSALAAPRPYYGYGPCWRWVAGPSGPYWARVC